MVAAAFVAPYLMEATARFVTCAASLPGVRLGLVTSEPLERIAPALRSRLAGHWRVDNALDARQIAEGVSGLGRQMGRIERLVGVLEQLQVPLAQVREAMGIEGMDVQTALNVRDKPRMKDVLRAAGVPCARHALVHDAGQARGFAAEVGFPLVAKPPSGVGSQATFRLDDGSALEGWLGAMPPSAEAPALLEEFLLGEEYTFDSVTLGGTTVWSSIAQYLPPPLDVLRNPWIQLAVTVAARHRRPRVRRHPRGRSRRASRSRCERRAHAHGVVPAARRVGSGLGGGGAAAGREPDVDARLRARLRPLRRVGRLAVLGSFDVPERRFASGTAYLRGMGRGRVRAVHGVDEVQPSGRQPRRRVATPQAGRAGRPDYTGQGYVIVRDPQTEVVREALRRIVNGIRVELLEAL